MTKQLVGRIRSLGFQSLSQGPLQHRQRLQLSPSEPDTKVVQPLAQHMLLITALLLLGHFAILGRASSTANTVESSAVVQTLIKTMPVSATDTCDENGGEESDSGFGVPALKGFRKRWAGQLVEPQVEEAESEKADGSFSEMGFEEFAMQKKSKLAGTFETIPIVDGTVDELVDQQPSKPPTSSSGHQLERSALLGTDMNVFKYPWEKGRLARIFGSEPLVKPPKLKLAPGGVNPVQLSLDVGSSGSVSAKAVVKAQTDDSAVFMQVVRKVEDVVMVADKKQKRETALRNFWELLS